MQVQLYSRKSASGAWQKYAEDFMSEEASSFTLNLVKPLEALQVRLMMTCVATPSKDAKLGCLNPRVEPIEVKSRVGGKCNHADRRAQCDLKYTLEPAYRTFEIALEESATYFRWNTTTDDALIKIIKTSFRKPDTSRVMASAVLGEQHQSVAAPADLSYMKTLVQTQAACPNSNLVCPAQQSGVEGGGVDCGLVNTNEIIQAQFAQWRTFGNGLFLQEPGVDVEPRLLSVGDTQWMVTASKRNTESSGFMVEKRLICMTKYNAKAKKEKMGEQQCCVNKFVYSVNATGKDGTANQPSEAMKAAILRNF